MKRALDPSERGFRFTSLCVCLAVLISSLAIFPAPLVSGKGTLPVPQKQNGPANDKGRKVKPLPPEKGRPAMTLPNLDDTIADAKKRLQDSLVKFPVG